MLMLRVATTGQLTDMRVDDVSGPVYSNAVSLRQGQIKPQ